MLCEADGHVGNGKGRRNSSVRSETGAKHSKEIALILRLKGATLRNMKRGPGVRVALILAAFFSLAILCSTFSAPSRALASVGPCSQMPHGMAMKGCEHPNYLCGFDPTATLFSDSAINSVQSNDSLKILLGFAFGGPVIDVSTGLAPPGATEWTHAFFHESGKVPIRLFNSVLNL